MQKQIDVERVQFRREPYEILQASPELVHRPRHHYVKPALCGVTA
jgi:hypothetical protein